MVCSVDSCGGAHHFLLHHTLPTQQHSINTVDNSTVMPSSADICNGEKNEVAEITQSMGFKSQTEELGTYSKEVVTYSNLIVHCDRKIFLKMLPVILSLVGTLM